LVLIHKLLYTMFNFRKEKRKKKHHKIRVLNLQIEFQMIIKDVLTSPQFGSIFSNVLFNQNTQYKYPKFTEIN